MLEFYTYQANEPLVKVFFNNQGQSTSVSFEYQVTYEDGTPIPGFEYQAPEHNNGLPHFIDDSDGSATGIPGAMYYKLPLPIFTQSGRYIIYYKRDPDFIEKERILVTRPYVTYEEIAAAFPALVRQGSPNFRNHSEIIDMERRIRYVVDSFCRQQFDLFAGQTKTLRGVTGDSLAVPQRIAELLDIRTSHVNLTGMVEADEWVIRYTGPQGFYMYRDIKKDVGPGMGLQFKSPFFHTGNIYKVTANWGWREVPAQIRHAARMLIWDYFQPEAEWRRRNVDVLRAADWRMEFAGSPIGTTGNLDVDLMLSGYVAPSLAVI